MILVNFGFRSLPPAHHKRLQYLEMIVCCVGLLHGLIYLIGVHYF
jgi:hypothetical protein